MADTYLPLTEYSSKHKVSISTLRRRIKADEIKYRFEDGKYLILDEASGTSHKVHRPSQSSEQTSASERMFDTQSEVQAPATAAAPVRSPGLSFHNSNQTTSTSQAHAEWHPEIRKLESKHLAEEQEPILTAANQLLTQLKKAYMLVLQEKEEQILHLKEEVSDLKTLVRVLESENEKLQR